MTYTRIYQCFLTLGFLISVNQLQCSSTDILSYEDGQKKTIKYMSSKPKKQQSVEQSLETKINNVKKSLEQKEDYEKEIRDQFSTSEKQTIFNKMIDAELDGNSDLKLYTKLSAIFGFSYAQSQWSSYLCEERNYNEAAKWYIRSANKNSDASTYLYENHIFSPNSPITASPESIETLVNHWKDIYG